MGHIGDNSDVELQVAEIQRKYRIMEGSRRSYSEDSQSTIRRQRATIEQLKADNSKLKEQLQLETKSGIKAPTPQEQQEISRLHDLADTYTRKIELEKRRLEELDQAEALAAAKSLEQRKNNGGVNAGRDHHLQVQRQVKVLEERLHKAIVKFNEALAHNKDLRDEIDNLRRERVVFDQIYKKLDKELQQKKGEMARVIEVSNIAYDARDQAQNEMAALRAQADKEQAVFEREWRDLGEIIERDMKFKEAMRREELNQLGDLSMDDETHLKRKLQKGSWALAKDKAGSALLADTMQSYEDAFARIQAATGISDIDELVSSFIAAEDENYTLFNYVNELSQEQEKLQEQVTEISEEAERLKGQGSQGDTHNKRVITDLEDRMTKAQARTEQYVKKNQAIHKNLTNLKSTVALMFNKLGCNKLGGGGAKDVVGDSAVAEGVRKGDSDLILQLSVIDQRASEVLQALMKTQTSILSDGESGSRQGTGIIGPQTPAGSAQVGIEPPTTGEDFDSDQDSEDELDDRPLTRDELHARTMRSISKRETKMGKFSKSKRGKV